MELCQHVSSGALGAAAVCADGVCGISVYGAAAAHRGAGFAWRRGYAGMADGGFRDWRAGVRTFTDSAQDRGGIDPDAADCRDAAGRGAGAPGLLSHAVDFAGGAAGGWL